MLSNIQAIFQYRRLIAYLTWGRIKGGERDKTLGRLWSLLNPLASLGIYYFIFAVLFESGIENFVLFLFSAIIAWRFFSQCVTVSSTFVISNPQLVSAVYFPKAILPLSVALMYAHDYFYWFVTLLVMTIILGVPVTPMLFFWPLVFLIQFVFTLGISLLVANLGVFLRDLQNILEIVFHLMLYLSGTMYHISRVPEALQPYFRLNPIYIFFESYRNILLYNEFPPLQRLGVLFLLSLLMLFWALGLMFRKEGKYVKYV